MKLTVLGSGTGTPNPGRAASSILLELAGYRLLLDCGPAALNRLVGRGVDHRSLDAIFISHFHLDHTLDLWAWLFTAAYADFQPTRPVRIYAPLGFERLHRSLKQAYGPEVDPPQGKIQVVMFDPAPGGGWLASPHLPEVSVAAAPVVHRPESIAFRLEANDFSLVYSGDTGWSDDLVELAQGVDWLILEATRPDDNPVGGHLTPSEAGSLARRAGAKNLLLTHLSAKHGTRDPARAAQRTFNGPVIAAADGLVIDLVDGDSVTGFSHTGHRSA